MLIYVNSISTNTIKEIEFLNQDLFRIITLSFISLTLATITNEIYYYLEHFVYFLSVRFL